MSEIDYDDLSPRIREAVRWFNANGFETTDSGDGSNHAAGMECAVPYPHIVMFVEPDDGIFVANLILQFLVKRGLELRTPRALDDVPPISIDLSYSPIGERSVIEVSGVGLLDWDPPAAAAGDEG